MQSEGKDRFEKKELSDDIPKDSGWKLKWIAQRCQEGREGDKKMSQKPKK